MVLTTSIALKSSKHQYAYMDFMTTYVRVVCRKSSGSNSRMPTSQRFPYIRLPCQSLSVRQGLEQGRGTEAPWCSYVEAFSTTTCTLDVRVVEDKFTRQLWLHKVHLSSQKGQLGFLLYKHSYTWKKVKTLSSLLSGFSLIVSRYLRSLGLDCLQAVKHKYYNLW